MIDFVAQIKINMKMECRIIREYYVGVFSIIFVPPQFADVILEYGWLFYCFCLLPLHIQVSALYQRPLHPPSPASAVQEIWLKRDNMILPYFFTLRNL